MNLSRCVTEFGAQGLELVGVLLAWGTDLLWTGDAWSNARAKNHARGTHVRDPFQLRVNDRKAEMPPGLELADLVVSLLGRLVAGMPARPDAEIVVGKLRTGPDGGWEGAGLVVLLKAKGRDRYAVPDQGQ